MANIVYGSATFARPPTAPQYQYHSPDGTSKWKGPRRVCIFCSTAIILPSILISLPLLMRFVFYGSNSQVLHPSDMMILDQRISTTWCEAETVTVNTSFTAYVTQGEPKLFKTPTTLTVDQHMKIPDDQKEFWGLYLLPGSTFTIRTCAKFKGGTLLIVRGNNHMQYCAYVGEGDSAGNSDQVSGSASYESLMMSRKNQQGGGGTGGAARGSDHASSKEKGQDDVNILSRLKNYLETHPDSRGKIQKTLEDWMLLNSSHSGDGGRMEETTPPSTTTLKSIETTSLEHGTIRRKRQAIDIRPDTESGENGAFEDDDDAINSISNSSDFILPHPLQKNENASVLDLLKKPPPQTPESIWKEQHSQHSGVLNINPPNSSITGGVFEDGSASESESSFSSSEEALLKCEGIIASFKVPYEEDACVEEGPFDSLALKKAFPGLGSNAFQFEVQERDYYYFIFGSENEKQTNSIRAKIELQKMEYQLPEPLENCTGVQECHIPFGFASSEKVVIKLPQPLPTANSNIVYVAETVCKPRSHLYLIFVILVPVVILMFAFK